MNATTLSGLQDHDAEIDSLLAVARRETLLLAIAIGAVDDDATAIASARLRWAIGSARRLIVARDWSGALGVPLDRRARELDRIANRAQHWLASEPPQPLQAIGGLVDRVASRSQRRTRAITAEHASLVDLDIDELDLARILLRGANLTDITARRTTCDAADASSTRWLRCQLDACSAAMAVFADSSLEQCALSRSNLEGTSWHRTQLVRCDLVRALLTDARLDRAVLTDCDLRGADLRIAKSPGVATLAGARFVRCDLRDTNWTGRDLGGVALIDCKLFGAFGAPQLDGVAIERPDLSLGGDGSRIATQPEVVTSWRAASL